MSDATMVSAAGWRMSVRVPGVSIVLAALIAVFGVMAPDFISFRNLANVLSQASILLILALPMTLVIMTEGLDLSVGAVVGISSMALAMTIAATGGVLPAIAVCILIGVAFGVSNGLLVVRLQLPPFVATLGTMGVAHSMALALNDGQAVLGIPESVRFLYSGTIFGMPMPVLLAATVYGALSLLLYRTPFGGRVFALGGNREALHFAGLSASRSLLGVYAIMGGLAGLAAVLMTARVNAGHPTAALGLEFEAIAAVAIGGTSFARGDGTLLGTLIGVVTVGTLRNGLNLLGVGSSLQIAAVGALVIVALLIDAVWKRSSR
jgi:ribose transport system permease protein